MIGSCQDVASNHPTKDQNHSFRVHNELTNSWHALYSAHEPSASAALTSIDGFEENVYGCCTGLTCAGNSVASGVINIGSFSPPLYFPEDARPHVPCLLCDFSGPASHAASPFLAKSLCTIPRLVPWTPSPQSATCVH